MEPERPGRRRNSSWLSRGRNAPRSTREEEAEDPFADEVKPVFSRPSRGRSRPQRHSNAFPNLNTLHTTPEDVFGSPRYEDPFADARARNRAQVASSNPWQTAVAPASAAPNSFASHLFQGNHSGGANMFSASAPQDVFQTSATELPRQEAPEFGATSVGAGFSFPNANDSSKPPKYPFKNPRTQPASSFGAQQTNQGLAPRKQFTSFGTATGIDEVEEWSAQEEENTNSRSWKGNDAEERNKPPLYTGERLSLFIRSVPVSLFSTRAMTEHFERLPVTVSNVSLRGSKLKDSNRTAVVTFESVREASVAYSGGRLYNGTLLNIQFYEPYEVRKNSRIKDRDELKRMKETSPKLILSQVPKGLRTGRQVKHVLDGFADGVVDVKLTHRSGADGMQRAAIITMRDDDMAEALLKSKARHNNRKLYISYLEDVQTDDDHMETKNEQDTSTERRASRKGSKQMTEQERLREMEQLRREIAIIEEKKRQQESRKEKQLLQKQKRAASSREFHERLQSDTDQRKVDERLSKYGSQKSSKEPKKTYEPAKGEHWRKVGQKMDIQDAKQFVGVCLEMCPLSEFESRVEQRDVSLFELKSGLGSEPDRTKAVKKYRRSAAISEEQKPEEVRPPHVLAMTMDHLKKVCDSKQAAFYEIHNFVRDRTRSIRQDFTLQGIRDDCCIKIHEESVRFHIMSEHRLYGTNPAQFSSKQNLEQLDKCLISLREMYDLRREQNLRTSPNEPEMQAYYILTQMSDPQTCVQLWTGFAQDVRRSYPVRLALEVVKAAGGDFANPVRFFSCVRQAPYLMACLMHSRFMVMRVQALRLLNSTYGSTGSRDEIGIDALTKRLCFEDEGETQEFCEILGFEVLSSAREEASQQIIAPPCREFDTSRISLFRTTRSDKIIESKACQLAPSDIIEGAPGPRFADVFHESADVFHVSRTVADSKDTKLRERESVQRTLQHGNVLRPNAPRKQESASRISSIQTKASGEIKDQNLTSVEQRSVFFGAQTAAQHEESPSLGLFLSQSDSRNRTHLVAGGSLAQAPGEATSFYNGTAKPSMSAVLLQSGKRSTAVHSDENKSTTGSKFKALGEVFSMSGGPVRSAETAPSTNFASSANFHVRNGNKVARDGLRSFSVSADAFAASRSPQRIGEHSNIEEEGRPDSVPQRVYMAEKPSEKGITVSNRIETESEEEGQKRIRERASRLVEERQRIVTIAKKARENRYRERCDKVLNEIERYRKSIEETMEEAAAVIRSLNTGVMSRSDTLNASHTGFEHLDRALAKIKRAEEFLEEAKGWSWEGQEFPPQPFPTLSSLREKGHRTWEEMSEYRRKALLKSPEAPKVDEHGKKFFYGNRKHVTDLQLPLEMSMKTVTDRIPILSLPNDKFVPSPGSEIENVFRTLRKLRVLQWQAVIVGEKQGRLCANAITTSWLRIRLGKSVEESGMVINAKNKDVVKYPCLSVLRVENDDDLPVTASTIIWSVDGSKGESGLHEEQNIIQRRLCALQSQSRSVRRAPPFLILVCFNSMGPMSPSLKQELEGSDSKWAQSLLTQDLVCGVRCVVLSREVVLRRDQDSQLTRDIEESIAAHRSHSVTHCMDFQLQRVSDRLVEVGNNAWMEVLDKQLSRVYHSDGNELCDVIRIVNKNWHGVAKDVSDDAKVWPTEFSHHRVHFVRVGAELIRRMRLPVPSESDEHSYARYLRLLCTSAGIAFPKIHHDGFQGLVEFCRGLGIIMPRLVASLLQDLKDIEVPLLRIIQEERQTSRVRRLNVVFTSMFAGGGNGYSSDIGDRRRKDSSLGKRQRDGDDGEREFHQDELDAPMQKRRLSLNEEYNGVGGTPKRRFSLPWKTFGSRRWSERYEFIVAETEAFGEEIDATIELISKRRKVAEPERQLVVSG